MYNQELVAGAGAHVQARRELGRWGMDGSQALRCQGVRGPQRLRASRVREDQVLRTASEARGGGPTTGASVGWSRVARLRLHCSRQRMGPGIEPQHPQGSLACRSHFNVNATAVAQPAYADFASAGLSGFVTC